MSNIKQVKMAARGQWFSILTTAGLPEYCLSGKNQPCPKCGGTDRFAAFKDVAETGGVNCRKCHQKQNGDGIATVQWWCNCTLPEAVQIVADHLGLNQETQKSPGKHLIDSTYDYRDEAGRTLLQVVRFYPKGFKQRQPKPGGGWNWSVKGVRVVPYQLPELLAKPTQTVFIVEGEKDADTLSCIGLLATCNAGGAGKWTDKHSTFLRHRNTVVLCDNDQSGRDHAQLVARSLQGVAASVRIVELPGISEKGDVSDWIAAAGTKKELKRLAAAAPVWKPTEQPWPDILSFDVLELPEFPTHTLPDALRHWVEAESHGTQTPADLAGLLALSVCSAMIARHVQVEPRPGWREPVNLFTAVLLEPGNRKSAVFANAMKPLRELEADLIETARPVIAREQSDRRQKEARLRKLEKAAGEKKNAESQQEAGNLAADLSEQIEPVLPRLLVDDTTVEKLGMMLAEQDGRIASMSPEGGVFDLMAGLYSKSGIPQFGAYLMGHSGDDLITDRVSRESVRVERPALTCAYAIQPEVIKGLAENSAFRGRGLLARFLYAAPQSRIGWRKIAPDPVSNATQEQYRQTVRKLDELEAETVLQLSPKAVNSLRDWETEIEAMLGDGGQMENMRDWGAKLAGATLRLAAVLHCVEYGPVHQIRKKTITAAIEIGRYLVPHADAVLNMMLTKGASGDADAHYVLRWIERHERREFTKRDAQQHGKSRFPKAEDIGSALAELTRRGYIRLRPEEAYGPGRPPSPTYEVNPAAFLNNNAKKWSHNSHKSPAKPREGISENIEYASEPYKSANRQRVTI